MGWLADAFFHPVVQLETNLNMLHMSIRKVGAGDALQRKYSWGAASNVICHVI